MRFLQAPGAMQLANAKCRVRAETRSMRMRHGSFLKRLALVLAVVAAPLGVRAPARADTPLPIKVVVVTTFEVGADTGDVPGEFQYWVERFPLAQTLPFPQGYRALRYDAARGVLGIVTGEGAERGAASIMALGSDPRFDLSHAYWLIAAIAGVDPNAASVGSAAWANFIVNGDLAFELDRRDAPAAWTTGIVPFDRTAPYAQPAPPAASMHGQQVFELNADLAAWAFARTKATPLPDDANLRAIRAAYGAFPNAMRPPFVLRADDMAADRWFVGPTMNAWAERWIAYWTGGRGTFAMTAEEDAGIMQSLTFLANAKRVDLARVMALRTAANYDTPGAGQTPAALLAADVGNGSLSAYKESLEAAYRVGSPIVEELAAHWDRYEGRPPSGASP
jgi:purine nucleoside permease